MSLCPIGTIDHEDRIVHHGQGLLHLSGKIHMTRGIKEGHRDILKLKTRHLREDGDAALLLHLVGIEVRVTLIDPSQLLNTSGSIENPLRQRRLPSIYMCENAQYQSFCIIVCHLNSVHPYTVS